MQLDQLEKVSSEKEEPKKDTKHYVEVAPSNPLYASVQAHKAAKTNKGEASALDHVAKRLYAVARSIVNEEHWGNAEAPKQIAFRTDEHTVVINVMSGGYKVLDSKGGEVVRGITGSGFYNTHVGKHYTVSVNLSEVPKDMVDEVVAHLMHANEIVGGNADKPDPKNIVKVDVKVKVKETFHNAIRTELDPMQIEELGEAGLQTRVQFSATKNA